MTSKQWPFSSETPESPPTKEDLAWSIAQASRLGRDFAGDERLDKPSFLRRTSNLARVLETEHESHIAVVWGQAVRDARTRINLTRQEFAQATGLDFGFIVLLENGYSKYADLTYEVESALAGGLRITIDEFSELISEYAPTTPNMGLYLDTFGSVTGVLEIPIIILGRVPVFPVFDEDENEVVSRAGMFIEPAMDAGTKAPASQTVDEEYAGIYSPILPLNRLGVVLSLEPLEGVRGAGVGVVVTDLHNHPAPGWHVELTRSQETHPAYDDRQGRVYKLETDSDGRAEFWATIPGTDTEADKVFEGMSITVMSERTPVEMETHLHFATRFALASGCTAKKNPSRNAFSLWVQPHKPRRNVPGWIQEWATSSGWFRVSTYDEWASPQAKRDAHEMVPNMHWNRLDGLVFWVANGSTEADFQRAVEAITSVTTNPKF